MNLGSVNSIGFSGFSAQKTLRAAGLAALAAVALSPLAACASSNPKIDTMEKSCQSQVNDRCLQEVRQNLTSKETEVHYQALKKLLSFDTVSPVEKLKAVANALPSVEVLVGDGKPVSDLGPLTDLALEAVGQLKDNPQLTQTDRKLLENVDANKPTVQPVHYGKVNTHKTDIPDGYAAAVKSLQDWAKKRPAVVIE